MLEHAAFSTEEGKKYKKSFLKVEMLLTILLISWIGASALHFIGTTDYSGFIRDVIFFLTAYVSVETSMIVKAKNFIHDFENKKHVG